MGLREGQPIVSGGRKCAIPECGGGCQAGGRGVRVRCVYEYVYMCWVGDPALISVDASMNSILHLS